MVKDIMGKNVVLENIRHHLKLKNLNAFIQPRGDMYGGEEVPNYDERLKFLSGFTGSAGIAIVTMDAAVLFVDGRYTLQAKLELVENWLMLSLTEDSMIKWVKENISNKQRIGYDPWLMRAHEIIDLKDKLIHKEIIFEPQEVNLIDQIWIDRPSIKQSGPIKWPNKFFGLETEKKIFSLTQKMKVKDLDAIIVTQPNQLSWLLNIRGNDLDYTPLFLGFGLLTVDGKLKIFSRSNKKTLKNGNRKYVNHYYEKLVSYISNFKNKKISVNPFHCPSIIYETMKENNIVIEDKFLFLQSMATIKNSVEIAFIKNCHKRDGAALIKFLFWLEHNIFQQKISEYDALIKLKEFRLKDSNFISESFHTIAASGSNGAIVHYRPTKVKPKLINTKEIFLLDSGGQYFDGTTDITRTISFSEQPQEIKNFYTFVLKSHISLAKLIFHNETSGNELDAIARSVLWKQGLDYNHGTGHGVGYCLGVHEFPPIISRRISEPLQKGQLLSNEPGYYVPKKFGIRLENLMIVEKVNLNKLNNFLKFKTVSLCHFEMNLINKNLLNKDEIIWINNYHNDVYTNLKELLTNEEKKWLKNKTNKILL